MPSLPESLEVDRGDYQTNNKVRCQREDAQGSVIASDEDHHDGAKQDRNADGGDGVGVEHLQKLNV